MRIEDLSIGDWFAWVDRLGHRHFGKVTVATLSNMKKPHNVKYEPIPLNDEMLKANGFYQESDDVIDMVWRAHPFKYEVRYGYLYVVIRAEGAKDKEAHGHFPCKQVILDAKVIYVHELQRALRVCGYYEQADKFRIG